MPRPLCHSSPESPYHVAIMYTLAEVVSIVRSPDRLTGHYLAEGRNDRDTLLALSGPPKEDGYRVHGFIMAVDILHPFDGLPAMRAKGLHRSAI